MTDDELKKLVTGLAIGQKELYESQARTAEKLEHLYNADLSKTDHVQDDIAKEFFFHSLIKDSRLGSVHFDDIEIGKSKHRGKIQEEYDLFMTNDDTVGIVAVKYKLHNKDLDKLDRKIDNFKKLYPIYQNHKLYGALACFQIHDDLKQEALDRGYFVLQRSSLVIHNEFKPGLKQTITHSKKPTVSLQDYLANDFLSSIKQEYINGCVYPIPEPTQPHDKISHNTLARLNASLKKHNPAHTAYINRQLKQGGKYFYPDVMVVCDEHERDEDYKTAPVILVEVLSAITRKKDLTLKRFFYQHIASLQEYVLIEQDKMEIQVRRKTESWQSRYYYSGDKITFESMGVTVSVADIYAQVDVEQVLD